MRPTLDGVVVLVVEDDHYALELMRAVLRHCGAVVAASDAGAAVGILDIVQPTVLVSDITMPGADGWWLVAEARRRGRLQGVPKIAVTAVDLRPDEVTDGGFDAFLRKPVDIDVLCATVGTLARRQSA